MNREKAFKRKKAFKSIEKFHHRRAKLPFREKFRILIELQELAEKLKKE